MQKWMRARNSILLFVIIDFVGLLFSPEFLPGIKVHPRHLCDPSGTENSVGIRLRYSAARLQFQ